MPPARNLASSPCSAIERDRFVGRPGAHVVERGGNHLAAFMRLGRGEHRLHDVVVAGAAAEVALEAEPHVVLGRVRDLLEQRHRRHHHARGAVAALQPVVLVERGLHRVPLVAVGEALDRRDRRAVGLRREHRARLHRLAVDQHRARAAARRVAADLRAGEAARLAEVLHEQRARLDVVVLRRAVDRHPDLHGAGN